MQLRPRSFLAPNASPMTMDGTITYVVGRRRIAIIDPGSDDPAHQDALAAVAAEAERTVIIVTHDHPDHSTGALPLAARTGAILLANQAGRHGQSSEASLSTARAGGDGSLADGAGIDTDEGQLIVIRTPGHAPDHVALHWPDAAAVFCGDLMMGGLDTAVVAAPEGDIGAYLDSLDRLRSLHPSIIYPSHGPAFTEPDAALDRYIRHREERLEQVRAAVKDGQRDTASITDRIHGTSLDPGLRPFAEAAVAAYLKHLQTTDRV